MHSPSSDTRFNEAKKLLNYGFSNFTNIPFDHKGDVMGNIKVEKGVISQIDAVMQEDASFFIEKSQSSKIEQNVSFKETLEAPIEKGAVVGEVSYSVDGRIIKKINIVASESVKKFNIINMTTNLYYEWFNLLR